MLCAGPRAVGGLGLLARGAIVEVCHGGRKRLEEEGGGAGSREAELALLDSSRLDPTRLVATEQFTMGQ
jgi:hypothetical protein